MNAAMEAIGLNDERLAQAVRDGRPDAWEVVYDALGERVFRLALRLTGDADLAADLTHDTFVQVVERGRQYRGTGSLAGWVCRIAANLAKERVRRDAARRRLAAVSLADRPTSIAPTEPELRLVLDAAVARLPEEQRAVILLYDVDGYTHPQIAEMLNIPVGTSKARLSRARAGLREMLRDAL